MYTGGTNWVFAQPPPLNWSPPKFSWVSCGGRNHVCQLPSLSFQGFHGCNSPKIGLVHSQRTSPLQQLRTNVLHCDIQRYYLYYQMSSPRKLGNDKSNGSAGPDGFSPILLKKIAASIITPLSLLFTSFISIAQVPTAWTTATVTRIHKGRLASNPANYYRLISLASVFCKLMQRVINRQMLDYIQRHGLLDNNTVSWLNAPQ